MLENLRDKLHSVQQDLSLSLRNLTLGDLPKSGPGCERKLVNAGAELLHHYQSRWEELHGYNEANARQAEAVDALTADLHRHCQQQLAGIQQLCLQVAQLPKLQQGVQELMKTIGELEGMFEEVELRLVSLEDVIETQALQERQLDERFKLALYGEKRKGHFESLQEKLEDDHLLMVHQLEERERAVLRERQQAFSDVFQEDLEAYRAQGRIQRIEACPEQQRVDLEDIDLEGSEEEQEALDQFLASTSAD
ncbi:dysbindin-like isoform X1 [Ixodes scapularis]|uniref:dysbindin-like isoform X1 n=1 Tax=Ixodes scapularis TaxID=6945 RepID=UPI001A9F5C4C|nr:dysbindin-like isoform X1 [Ixodes scapularis]